MMNGFEIIGYLAGVLTAICFLPQTIKTLKTRDTQSISVFSYILYCIGILCWIIYGSYLNSAQMVIFNAISLVFAVSILVVALYNLKK